VELLLYLPLKIAEENNRARAQHRLGRLGTHNNNNNNNNNNNTKQVLLIQVRAALSTPSKFCITTKCGF
jgi:hypothetical protein